MRASRATKRAAIASESASLDFSSNERISVVVPAWNEQGSIARCLSRLLNASSEPWECIIVAGGDDNTLQISRDWARKDKHFRVLVQRGNGKNAAINDGLSLITGSIVVLLDADTEVPSNYFSEIRRQMTTEADVLLPNYVPYRNTRISRIAIAKKVRAYEILGRNDFFGGGSLVLREKCLRSMLPLPENLEAAVDWDLGKQAHHRDLRIHHAKEIVVKTEISSDIRSHLRGERRWKKALIKWMIHQAKEDSRYVTLVSSGASYLASLIMFSLFAIGTFAFALHPREMDLLILGLIFVCWNIMRNISYIAEVAVYERKAKTILLLPTAAVLHMMDTVASLEAIFTRKTSLVHFKGERRGYE